MTRRLLLILTLLALAPVARAAEIRIAAPSRFADDVFLKTLASSKILVSAGLTVAVKSVQTDAEAMEALKKGEADLGLFALNDKDRRAQQSSGAEASLLTRPFVFKSAQEVSLMQDSFLGAAAEADAGRSGLFPLKIWTHAMVYMLSRGPIQSQEEFAALTVAADNGAPDAEILSAIGAKTADGSMSSMEHGGADALETRLDPRARNFAAKFDGKLYMTTCWPETGMLVAAPAFWMERREIEKNAIKAAAEQARAASDSDLTARENSFAKLPNVIVNHLDSGAQKHLAMRAGGGGEAAMSRELELWRKAEIEVRRQPAPAPKLAPPPKMTQNSPAIFVTDRNDEMTPDLKTRFGSRRLDPIEITCGYLGAPRRHSGEPRLPAAAQSLTKGSQNCAREIVARTRAAGAKKILFVVHGFNISFSSLLWRVLQLASDLDYDGSIVGWSWPSEGSALSYAYDEDSNAWSEPHVFELVNEIASIAPDLQLDFVAHSMGNRILLQMLRDFSLTHSNIRVGAAVFAAPDMSQDVFREQIKLAREIGALRTLYASEYDRAILISESYHGAPRAGSGGGNILVAAGIESVDARLGGHSYVFDEPKAVQDFEQIVNREIAAPQRGLPEREKAGKPYWVIEP